MKKLLFAICVLTAFLVIPTIGMSQGAAPAPTQKLRWDARKSGLKDNDSTTSQTTAILAAAAKARSLNRILYIPAGVYTFGLNLDGTYDGLSVELGGLVRIKNDSIRITGTGPNLSASDVNYNGTTTNYLENVTIFGGTLVLGVNAGLRMFYCKDVNISSPVVGQDRCIGINLSSNTHDVNFGDIHIRSTKINDATILGAFWVSRAVADSSSTPRNITVRGLHVDSSHFYGALFSAARNVSVASLRVDTSGLCGLRVTGDQSGRLHFGDVYVAASGANATNAATKYLHSGISIDGSASNVSIDKAIIRRSYNYGIVIPNTAKNVSFGVVTLDSCATDEGFTAGDPAYSIFINSADAERIHFDAVYINQAMIPAASIAFAVVAAKDVSVDQLSVSNGYATGLLVSSEARHFNAGTVVVKKDLTSTHATPAAVKLSGLYRSEYNIDNIFIDSVKGYGLYIAGGGANDSSSICIGNLEANGDEAANNYSGIYLTDVDGYVDIQRARIFNYNQPSTAGRGFQVDGANTGQVHIGTLELWGNTYGIYWNNTSNENFTFDNIIVPAAGHAQANTNDYSTSVGVNFLSDIRTRVAIVDHIRDTMLVAGYPVKQATAPALDGVLKIAVTGSDTSWYFGTDAGASAGDNVYVDTGTGSIDVSNPVFKEGTGIVLTQSGSNVTITGTGSIGTVKRVGATGVTDSIALINSGGFQFIHHNGATSDTVFGAVKMNTTVLDTSNANGNTQGNITVAVSGLDSLHVKTQGLQYTDIDSVTGEAQSRTGKFGSLYSPGAQYFANIIPYSGTVVIFGDGATGHKLFSNDNLVPDSAYSTLGFVRARASDTANTRWRLGGTTYPFAFRFGSAGNDTVIAIKDSSTTHSILRSPTQALILDGPAGLTIKGQSGGAAVFKTNIEAEGAFILDDTTSGITVSFEKIKSGTDSTDKNGYVWKYKNIAGTKADSATLQADNNSGGGGGGLGGLVVIDTNQNGITTVTPDSIYLHGGGGIGYRFVTGTTKDSLAIRVRADGTYIDTTGTQGAIELKASSVDSTRLGANSVLASEIAADAVDALELRAASKLPGLFYRSATKGDTVTADSVVATRGYVNRLPDYVTIDTSAGGKIKVATGGVGVNEIATDGVGAAEIATDAVGSAEIAADAVGVSEIATDGVGQAEIAADAVGVSEIGNNAVRAAEIDSTQTDFRMRGLTVGDTILAGLGLGIRMKQTGTNSPVIVRFPRVIDTANASYILKYTNVAGTATDSLSWAVDATGGGGGTSVGRISVWDGLDLDDSGSVTLGSGIGSTINLTPSPNTITLWADPDGTSMDTTGGKITIKTAGVTGTKIAENTVQPGDMDSANAGYFQFSGVRAYGSGATGGLAFHPSYNAQANNSYVYFPRSIDSTLTGMGVPVFYNNTASATDSFAVQKIQGAQLEYRRVEHDLSRVHVRKGYTTSDSLTITLNEMEGTATAGDTASFQSYLFSDSTNYTNTPWEGDDTIYVIGVIPEDILADSIFISYRNNGGTFGTHGGLQDVQWFYRSAITDSLQQPANKTATGTANALNLSSATWALRKINLSGVTILAGTEFKVRLIMDFPADNAVCKIGRVVVVGRRR